MMKFQQPKSGAKMTQETQEILTKKTKMMIELMRASGQGVETVWYGHVEQAEPVEIYKAIRDIARMDDAMFQDGSSWGEWPIKA